MNLYLVHYATDCGENLDWHVKAQSPGEARELWAAHARNFWSDDLTAAHADVVHLVMYSTGGGAGVLEWLDAEEPA